MRNVTVCALTSSRLDDFSDNSYLYTVMITTFLGGSWAFWGGSFYPSNTVDSIPCQKSGGQRLVFL